MCFIQQAQTLIVEICGLDGVGRSPLDLLQDPASAAHRSMLPACVSPICRAVVVECAGLVNILFPLAARANVNVTADFVADDDVRA